jgi:hypothetical protein
MNGMVGWVSEGRGVRPARVAGRCVGRGWMRDGGRSEEREGKGGKEIVRLLVWQSGLDMDGMGP